MGFNSGFKGLIAYLHLGPRFPVNGAILRIPLYVFIAWTRAEFTLFKFYPSRRFISVICPKKMNGEYGTNGTENKCKNFCEIPAGGRPLWKPKH